MGRRDNHLAKGHAKEEAVLLHIDRNTIFGKEGRQANGTMLEECEQEEG